jgi:nitrile hydratase
MTDEHERIARQYDPEARARALQSLLTEKGILSTDAVDAVIEAYEKEIGPLNGARVVARAWTDEAFKRRLLEDGTGAIGELGFEPGMGSGEQIEVVENTPSRHNVVVCTLCSCYPWALLGLPPTWYKSHEYRARMVKEPRTLLAEEFGCELPESVELEVWDSNAETRYLVLPQRPPETEHLDADALTERVTRNAMIGVERLGERGG